MSSDDIGDRIDPRVVAGACAIVDIWMGGERSWRTQLGDSDFLESADWTSALELAGAVIRSLDQKT